MSPGWQRSCRIPFELGPSVPERLLVSDLIGSVLTPSFNLPRTPFVTGSGGGMAGLTGPVQGQRLTLGSMTPEDQHHLGWGLWGCFATLGQESGVV